MASSRKDGARSAPRQKPRVPSKPVNGTPKRRAPKPKQFAPWSAYREKLTHGGKLLHNCWHTINAVYIILPEAARKDADLIRRQISVLLRELEDDFDIVMPPGLAAIPALPVEGGGK